jgi:hypothetical protein
MAGILKGNGKKETLKIEGWGIDPGRAIKINNLFFPEKALERLGTQIGD